MFFKTSLSPIPAKKANDPPATLERLPSIIPHLAIFVFKLEKTNIYPFFNIIHIEQRKNCRDKRRLKMDKILKKDISRNSNQVYG